MPEITVEEEVEVWSRTEAPPETVVETGLDMESGLPSDRLAVLTVCVGHTPLTCRNLFTVDEYVEVVIRGMPVIVVSGRVKVP